MLDFVRIGRQINRGGQVEVYPQFLIPTHKEFEDIMVRGTDFYAVWDEKNGVWSTKEMTANRIIDEMLAEYVEKNKDMLGMNPRIMWMRYGDTGMIDRFHHYCQKQLRPSFEHLDDTLVFANTVTTRETKSTKRLPYSLEPGPTDAYDKLMSTLYTPEERHKIEWCIGAIVTGASKKLQKFLVLYGSGGTGKSTVINIIEKLFQGYTCTFDAKALGSSTNQFALEPFKDNPHVAIQHDGELDKLDTNVRINSIVSHEWLVVNEKYKGTYPAKFGCFLVIGTNKPVKITDAKSGLIRRLIDVTPSGNKLPVEEYDRVVNLINFELGAIACKCRDVYLADPRYYDDYIPIAMMSASNHFFNFMSDSYYTFKQQGGTTRQAAWELYKSYTEQTKVPHPYSQMLFSEELKNYFKNFYDRYTLPDGTRVRSYYDGLISERFFQYGKVEEGSSQGKPDTKTADIPKKPAWLTFSAQDSYFETYAKDWSAQPASEGCTPRVGWQFCETKLSDIDSSQLHYVKPPEEVAEHYVVLDFDLKDETGKKCLAKNIEAASSYPETYAELSRSGDGIHLHYIYQGNVDDLAPLIAEHVEIKVMTKGSSLRRRLTLCNGSPIATISGLPTKGKANMPLNFEGFKSERTLRKHVLRHLNKEIAGHTAPSVNLIAAALDAAYNSGMVYDLSDLHPAVLAFAAGSKNQSSRCIAMVANMKFKSETEYSDASEQHSDNDIYFYDIEVFPNLLLVEFKKRGKGNPVVRMFNPSPEDIQELVKKPLVGFNNRGYDNHILYGRMLGFSNEQIYQLSVSIISNGRGAMFRDAYNLSYTDVYDFCKKKQSLKKWEIELGIPHRELGLPWNEPVPEEKWPLVADYCDNDVIATEAVFEANLADFTARKILADIAGLTVNHTTNQLTTRFIFGRERNPQSQFSYRFMGDMSKKSDVVDTSGFDEYTAFDDQGRPLFPGYQFKNGVSSYRDEKVGEGGYVYSEPGMHMNVALLDVESMHPSSMVAEVLFGPIFTKRFEDILKSRLAIKHKDYDLARTLLDGALAKYLDDDSTADALSGALKLAINSVYGQTFARYVNAFKDERNVDNIVAKRGALFMINLKHEVQKRGFIVAHIKTDSIKIPNATPEIIDFVNSYGKMYGYKFEHEATYDRMCLVNRAVYIARYATADSCQKLYGYVPKNNKKYPWEWTATGAQFAVPYVMKTLFTKEDIVFKDICETKSVDTAIYLDMNEMLAPVPEYDKEFDARWAKSKVTDPSKKVKTRPEFANMSDEEVAAVCDTAHNYVFVGKVGSFCPVKPGTGGGIMVAERGTKLCRKKYDAVTGTTGYRWLESEMLSTKPDAMSIIDHAYHLGLVSEAKATISNYGDFEWFISDLPAPDPLLGHPVDEPSPF